MPLIGEGSYGCIFKPIVTCKKKKIIPKESISKVFTDYSEFDLEKKNQNNIQKIDPLNKFTIPLYDDCIVEKFKKNDGAEKCTIINKKKNIKEYPQLIYKYGGGDLKDIIKNKNGNVKSFMNIFTKFRPILEGIRKIINANFVHQDIKPPNILYYKKTGTLYLIDFGILTSINDIYKQDNYFVLKYNYPYYPPEYKLFNYNGSFNKYYHKVTQNFNFNFMINKKNVNLLKIINEVIDIDIVKDLKNAYNNKPEIFNSSKVDLYSIGIVILELYIWSGLYNKKGRKFNNELKIKMNEFIKGLIRFNSLERYDIDKVIEEFDKIVVYWDSK